MVLKYDLSKVTEILRSKRGEKDYGCEKPWEPDNEFNRLERKQIAYHNFLRFFDENAEAIAALGTSKNFLKNVYHPPPQHNRPRLDDWICPLDFYLDWRALLTLNLRRVGVLFFELAHLVI